VTVFNTTKLTTLCKMKHVEWNALCVVVVVAIFGTYTIKSAVPVGCQWLVLREVVARRSGTPLLVVGVGVSAALHWFWVLSDPHTWVNLWCAWIFSMGWLILVPYCAYAWSEHRMGAWQWYRVAVPALCDIAATPCVTLGALVATPALVPDDCPPSLLAIIAVSVELVWRAVHTHCDVDCVLATAVAATTLALGACYHGIRKWPLLESIDSDDGRASDGR